MKALRTLSVLAVGCVTLALVVTAQGPRSTNGETVARPKKGTSSSDTPAATPDATPDKATDLPKIPSVFKKDPNAPKGDEPIFKVTSNNVTVDVAVLGPDGGIIGNIPKDYFRITEDNVPQKISDVSVGEAPMTITLVVEFSKAYQEYGSEGWNQTLSAADEFLRTLKPEDYVAVVAYDLRPEILSDFSTDRRDTMEAMSRLQVPAYREMVLYDALTDTAERMQNIEGRKAIVVLSSGIDTISHINYSQARKKIQAAGVPIYSVGLLQALRIVSYAQGAMSDLEATRYTMADLQLKTFSSESGGQSFFPRFYGEFPQMFQSIAKALRSQYVVTYTPSNVARDGKFRKLKVELIDPATNKPWVLKDAKGKAIKYQIVAKSGYTAPREIE